MTDWRKSKDGNHHAYVGPCFAQVYSMPQSSDAAGMLRASVSINGEIFWRVFVSDYSEGIAACEQVIDDFINEIKTAREKPSRLEK